MIRENKLMTYKKSKCEDITSNEERWKWCRNTFTHRDQNDL